MSILLYHNPKCSKSRETLAILEEKGTAFQIVDYLKDGITASVVLDLARKAEVHVSAIVRTGEELWPKSNPPTEEDDIAKLIEGHPILLQRPILADEESAIVARPPSLTHTFIQRNS